MVWKVNGGALRAKQKNELGEKSSGQASLGVREEEECNRLRVL